MKATEALIGERGLDGFSLADVGHRAGVSRGLAGHHFKSRERLIAAVASDVLRVPKRSDLGFPQLMASLDASLNKLRTGSPRINALLAFMTSRAEAPYKDQVRRYQRGAISMLENHIRAGVDRGEIRPSIDARSMATLIVGGLFGQALLAGGPGGSGLTKAQADAFLTWVRTSLELAVGSGTGRSSTGARASSKRVPSPDQGCLFGDAETGAVEAEPAQAD